jgi:hypothetical protein
VIAKAESVDRLALLRELLSRLPRHRRGGQRIGQHKVRKQRQTNDLRYCGFSANKPKSRSAASTRNGRSDLVMKGSPVRIRASALKRPAANGGFSYARVND